METVIESYIKFLYDPKYQVSKTIRGSNIPIEHDNKVNWIRECMNLEGNRMKINCLRKLRDQVAMNPFYQYRIDRFVDSITQNYERTDIEGTIPGNEFKVSELALQEKEWDENEKWKEMINKDLLKHVISKDSKTDQEEVNVNRHTIQPVLMNLIKNVGGDYMGRNTTRNSDHGDFAGVDYILSKLPDDWEEKVKNYVIKIAKKHMD